MTAGKHPGAGDLVARGNGRGHEAVGAPTPTAGGVGAGYLAGSERQLAQIARDAANRAMRLGAPQVVASTSEMAGIVMRVRGGKFESAAREGGQSLTIKVFDRGRTGTAVTSALTTDAIGEAAARAVAIARIVEPEPEAAPAAEEWLARGAPALELFEPSGLSAHDLGRTALEIEEAGLARGSGVRVGEAGAASFDASGAIAIGRDFDRSLSMSRHDTWCRVIAERGGVMAQDGWASSDRRLSRLLSPSRVGTTAAERAVRKLGGRSLAARDCPVLFDAPVAASLVTEIVGALGGRAQFHGASFFAGGKGGRELAEHVELVEDPFEPFGLASGTCDSEGVGSSHRKVIAEGRVEGYFLDCLYARKLGLAPTGSADGPRNLHFTSRRAAGGLDDLLRQLGRGLWVTELIGGAVDPVSGAYSKAAAGFWIENGEAQFPVHDITIAGEMQRMMQGIVAIGSDVHRGGAVRTGSVLIDNMRVAGR